jgi:hypothetical protein
MPTDGASRVSVDSLAQAAQARDALWVDDLRSVRIVRFGLGVALAMAIAFGFDWPLQFLLPVLTASLLGSKQPAPTLREGFYNILSIVAAFGLGLTFSLFALVYPLVYVPALGLVLFHIYYLVNRGGAAFFAIMLLIAVLLLPMMAQQADLLADGIASAFIGFGALSVGVQWLAHAILPDPLDTRPSAKRRGGFHPGYSGAAAHNAAKSTLVVLPVAILFIAAHWTSQALVIIFIAIYSVAPVLRVSKQDTLYKFLANVLGGCAALVFYWLLVAVPEYYFLIALSLLSALLFGSVMFSDRPTAPYYSSAFSTLLILISTSMGEGADFGANFWIRVGLVAMAGLYVVGALSVLEHIWPPPEPTARA